MVLLSPTAMLSFTLDTTPYHYIRNDTFAQLLENLIIQIAGFSQVSTSSKCLVRKSLGV